ncbi:MAG: hypothetical protein GEU28_03105 [Dehalococcoidia bacterium]|nr:hypothetical protein [Dehalococcoidia bacterium]
MSNTIVFGLIAMAFLLALISYVLVQEVRAQRHWRSLVRQGDQAAIRALVEEAMNGWRRGRPPKGVGVSVWGGVQSAEIVQVSPDAIRLSTAAEGQYSGLGDQRREVSSPLQEGKKIFVKLQEMVLYDIPNVRFHEIQIDVYTTFRHEDGSAIQRCILSGALDRGIAAEIDWDRETPDQIVERAKARFNIGRGGAAQPIEAVTLVEFPA